MSKTKPRPNRAASNTKEARLAVAESFTPGARVRHQVTGKEGRFQELNLGFALPEVWVQFESDRECAVPVSCNPLELELVNSEFNQQDEVQPASESQEAEAIPVVAIEVLEELTEAEEAERHRLELKVERAFCEAGTALRKLREQHLYRSTHRTFEEYCRDRFGFTRQSANYLIAGAAVVENLTTIGCQILPSSERQVRPLTKLKPNEQWEAWQQAVNLASGKVPSGRIVKTVVEQLKEKPLLRASDFCSVGDVFTLTGLEGAQHKYNGYPCVAVELKNFTVEVEVYDTTLSVKPENLKPIDSPDVRRQLHTTLKRIKRVRNVGLLDRGAYYVLEGLGRQTYLTDFEDKLLSFLEKEHGIESEP